MKKKITIILLSLIVFSCNSKMDKIKINHAQVQNMQDFADTIEVRTETTVEIYCTGELSPDWAKFSQRYMAQGDDIELYIRTLDKKLKKILFKESDKHGDTLFKEIEQVRCTQSYDRSLRKYIALIEIPLRDVLYGSGETRSFEFDLAAGDNDNGIGQKSKLCWANLKDPLFENEIKGRLLLSNRNSLSSDRHIAVAKKSSTDKIDWTGYHRYPISNIVAGQVNDTEDFSGFFQVCWTERNIHLRLEINDSKEGKFKPENLLKDDNFVDRGWIEDLKGKKIWQMNLLQSKHAGGAFKNQYCDTLLALKPGKYVVRYTSDESHGWNVWDSPRPSMNFWGIGVSAK